MMNYTDLVNDIETLSTYVSDGYTKAVLRRAAYAIEELQAAQKWIPVTERLPKEYVGVLCYCSRNGQYGCGEWCKEDNGTIYWIGLNGMIPTHWMPLPKTPKEETE